jgi:hypothetical protein
MWWLIPENPAIQEIRRIVVQCQPREKGSKNLSQQASWTWWFVPVILAMQKVYVGGSWSETHLGQVCESLLEK